MLINLETIKLNFKLMFSLFIFTYKFGLYLLVKILRGSRIVSEDPTHNKAGWLFWFPADCPNIPSMNRVFQHIVIFNETKS